MRRNQSNTVHSGELNRPVKLFKLVGGANQFGERKGTKQQVGGVKFCKRIDSVGSEDSEGQQNHMRRASFIFRYDPTLLVDGPTYIIEDVDGDFHVSGIGLTGQQKRFLELEAQSKD